MKKYWGIALEMAYFILSAHLNLDFEYCNGFEFLIGTIITTVIINVIEWSIYLIAFSLTRIFIPIIGHDSLGMKITHWSIRIVLCLLVIAISLTPVCSVILSPIIQNVTEWIMNYMSQKITELSNALLSPLMD